jgi:hypothetical protein
MSRRADAWSVPPPNGPPSSEEERHVALLVAGLAHDADDLRRLLTCLGLL